MIIETLIPAIVGIIEMVIPEPAAKAAAQLEVLKLNQAGEFKQIDNDLQLMLAQTRVNEAEANSPDGFRGGWRPAVGWVCVLGMSYTYLGQPLLSWLSGINGWQVPPVIDTWDLLIMLGGMLGFGGMRMVEKIRGKS